MPARKKERPPRIRTKNGKRYIKVGKRNIVLNSKLPTNQLVNVVVNDFGRRKRKNKPKKKGELVPKSFLPPAPKSLPPSLQPRKDFYLKSPNYWTEPTIEELPNVNGPARSPAQYIPAAPPLPANQAPSQLQKQLEYAALKKENKRLKDKALQQLEPALSGNQEVNFKDDQGREVVVIPKNVMEKGMSTINKLGNDITKKSNELKTVTSNLQKSEQQLEDVNNQLKRSETKIQQLTRDIAGYERTITGLQTSLQEKENEMKNLKTQHDKLKEQIKQQENDSREALRVVNEQFEKRKNEIEAETKEIKKQLSDANQDLKDAVQNIQKYGNQIDGLKKEQEELNAKNEDLKQKLEQEQIAKNALDEQVKTVKGQLEQEKQAKDALDQQVTNVKGQLNQANEDLDSAKSQAVYQTKLNIVERAIRSSTMTKKVLGEYIGVDPDRVSFQSMLNKIQFQKENKKDSDDEVDLKEDIFDGNKAEQKLHSIVQYLDAKKLNEENKNGSSGMEEINRMIRTAIKERINERKEMIKKMNEKPAPEQTPMGGKEEAGDKYKTPKSLSKTKSRMVSKHQDEELDEIPKLDLEANLQGADGKNKSDDGLFDYQIENLMKPYTKKGFEGVIAADELDKLHPSEKMSFIMNTDPRSKPGKHWVAVYIDAEKDMSVEYYDSFGDGPSKNFLKQLQELVEKIDPDEYLKLKVNRVVDQRADSSNCGWFAAKFLIDRFDGKKFKECSKFQNVAQGEKDIEKFKEKIEPFRYI